MAYNLQSRTFRQELLDETQEVPSEDEKVQESKGSENGGVSGHNSENSSSESDVEMEDTTLDKRLLESGARGRPCSTLKGKNGFK